MLIAGSCIWMQAVGLDLTLKVYPDGSSAGAGTMVGGTIGNGKPSMGGGGGKPGTHDDPKHYEAIFTKKSSFNFDLPGHDKKIYRARVKASYQTALVYYSLVTELKYMRRETSDLLWDNMYTNICFVVGPPALIPFKSYCEYKKNKDTSLHVPTVPHQNEPNWKYSDKLNWRPYEGSYKLNNYIMNVMFAFIDYSEDPAINTKRVQVEVTKS